MIEIETEVGFVVENEVVLEIEARTVIVQEEVLVFAVAADNAEAVEVRIVAVVVEIGLSSVDLVAAFAWSEVAGIVAVDLDFAMEAQQLNSSGSDTEQVTDSPVEARSFDEGCSVFEAEIGFVEDMLI